MIDSIYGNSKKLILAKNYQNQKVLLSLISSSISFIYTIFFVLFFLSQNKVFELNPFLSGICYFSLYFVSRTLLVFPFQIKQSFQLPKSIGLLSETFFVWLFNQCKFFVLILFLGSFASGFLLICIQKYPDFWWLFFLILISCFFVFIFLFGQTIIAPLFFDFEKLSDSRIQNSLMSLKKRIGLGVQSDIWVMKMKKHGDYANAFVSGFGPTRKIIITENILEYAPEEVECIVAHELAHQFFSHNLLLCIYKIVSFAGIIYLFKFLLYSELSYFQTNQLDFSSPNTIGIFLVFLWVLNFLVSPILLKISREMELACDLFAFKIVSSQKCMISILKKLCIRNFCDPEPTRLVRIFFCTHPPFSERIERLTSLLE